MHEYFKDRQIWENDKEGTTAVEILLDIYGYAGTIGDSDDQETWNIGEWNTNYIFNIKQFFKHFVEGHNPLKFQTTSNLSKCKTGTTNLALPFKIKLQNPEFVRLHLEAFRNQNITFRQWLIFKEIGPRSWPQLKNFDDETFGNKARVLFGLDPCPRTARTDITREQKCSIHNDKFGKTRGKHCLHNDFIMPQGSPPDNNRNYPQWWYTNAQASCIKCGEQTNFKELNKWLTSKCSGAPPVLPGLD
jgi:hypothetical protein